MRRRIAAVVVAAALMAAATLGVAAPASAQGGGCAAFGQNVASLAQSLGPTFGQLTSANAPANDLVEAEQDALCP